MFKSLVLHWMFKIVLKSKEKFTTNRLEVNLRSGFAVCSKVELLVSLKVFVFSSKL